MSARLDSLLDPARRASCALWDAADDEPRQVWHPRTDAELIADTSEDDAGWLASCIDDAMRSLRHALAALADKDLPSAEQCARQAIEDLQGAVSAEGEA